MYVVPAARGAGVARELLAALEDEARAARVRAGAARHGRRSSRTPARSTESVGYREIPDYNDNPYASFWGEREPLRTARRVREGLGGRAARGLHRLPGQPRDGDEAPEAVDRAGHLVARVTGTPASRIRSA